MADRDQITRMLYTQLVIARAVGQQEEITAAKIKSAINNFFAILLLLIGDSFGAFT